MLSVFTQLLPRTSVRCFATRAAIWNAFPPGYAVQGTQSGPYANVNIDGDTPDTWKNPIGDTVVEQDTRTPEEIWRENSKNNVPMLQYNSRMADAYQGRRVPVRGGNFEEAMKNLDIILARNRVRATVRATERHEKKGVKRRRIQSEQWRKHFAHQVRKNVQLVHKIRQRGA